MKVICTVNMKGGVGKTTISVGLAYELAASFSKKVLLVDIDSQTNATLLVLDEETYQEIDSKYKTLADLFLDDSGLLGERRPLEISDIIVDNPWNINNGKMDLVPSSIRLFEKKNLLTEMSYAEDFFKTKFEALEPLAYDYVIIDSPPDFDKLVIAALNASNWYIIPVRPDYMSQQGLVVLDRKIEKIKKYIDCEFLGIIISLIPPTRSIFHKEMIQDLRNRYKEHILAEIKEKQIYSKWPSTHRPLKSLSDREPFVKIAQKVIERC